MPLNGSLLERTQQAIIATFRREELQQFVHIELEENFEAIARDDNLRVQVYELLLWAGRNGREQFFLDHLAAARPFNADFAAVAEALRTGEPLVPADSQFVRPPGRGPVPLQKPLRVQHFTGREQELARLLADLQPGKILTLCGPGGMGKTALAAEAIWRLAPGDDPPDRFPDGVIFHTFYHQPQADAALEAIAHVYGADPRHSPRDAARLALAGRRALLVLDGAEAADDLDAVLSVTGSCGVLITTRRQSDAPSDFQGVNPLPLAESLHLLRAWAGPYANDDTTAHELVRLLGGLPLALYLVGRYLARCRQQAWEYAAWLDEQGVVALHFEDRPSKSIPLLLARSLEQVSAPAMRAFGIAGALALAPFAADPVAATLSLTPAATHRILAELIDFGLLLRPNTHYQVTHALAHSYARTQVPPDGETIGRLAMYFAAICEKESARGLGGYAVLDPQRPHIVAVQAAALTAGQWAAAQQIAWAAKDYLNLLGYWSDRMSVVDKGVAAARAARDRFAEIALLNDLGLVYIDLGQAISAIEVYKQVLDIGSEMDHRWEKGTALGNLGLAYYALGEHHRAIELYEQQLVTTREIDDRRGEGSALSNLGLAYAALGLHHRAIKLYEQQLVITREIGDRRGEGSALGNLGLAQYALHDPRRAIELYEEQLVITREIGDRRGEGNALGNLGLAYADLGEARRTIELYEQRLVIAREIGDRRWEGSALSNLGIAYAALNDPRRAIEFYEQGLVIAREIGDRRGEGAALGCLSRAYVASGEYHRAMEMYEKQLVITLELGDLKEEGVDMPRLRPILTPYSLGSAYRRWSKLRRAIERYEQASAMFRAILSPNAEIVGEDTAHLELKRRFPD